MLNKKNLFLLYLSLNLTICLKSNDFCILKQQECKGFHDNQHKYQIKCESIKCHGTFNNDCGFNICSRNKTICNDYIDVYSKIVLASPAIDVYLSYKEQKKQLDLFNKQISDCKNKIYKFESKDFCSNGEICFIIKKNLKGLGFYRKTTNKIDCRCPSEQSFKCGKYCATDSSACDFSKPNEMNNENHFDNIIHCGNNATYYRYN